MQFDWSIEEIDVLKAKAGAHAEEGYIKRHLKQLESHLTKRNNCLARADRQKAWEAVEDEAIKIDKWLADHAPKEQEQ